MKNDGAVSLQWIYQMYGISPKAILTSLPCGVKRWSDKDLGYFFPKSYGSIYLTKCSRILYMLIKEDFIRSETLTKDELLQIFGGNADNWRRSYLEIVRCSQCGRLVTNRNKKKLCKYCSMRETKNKWKETKTFTVNAKMEYLFDDIFQKDRIISECVERVLRELFNIFKSAMERAGK